jgi:hypothetical protein
MPRATTKKKPEYDKLDFDGDSLSDILWDVEVSTENFLTELDRGLGNVLKAIEKGDLLFAKGHLEALRVEIATFTAEGEECEEEEGEG